MEPIWWRNLLLILAGYFVLPLMGLMMGIEDTDPRGSASVVSVTANLNLIYIIWFIVLAVRKPKPKQPRFKSPFWIAGFAVAHYLLFLISLMSKSMALNMGFNGTAWWWHELNGLLCLPFFTDLTKNLITQNLPGPKAHLVFILNGLLFGTLLWVWFRFRNKKLLSTTPDLEVSEPNTVASKDASSN